MERPTELAVAAPVEAHPLNLARARSRSGRRGQGRESVSRSEAPDIADFGDDPSDRDRSRAGQAQERMAGRFPPLAG
jgi:hypothetical protein